MSSCSPVSGRTFLALCALGAVVLSGCTPAPRQDSPTPAASQSPSAPRPSLETGRDGRTVLPTEASTACGLIDEPAIRSSLGAVAGSLQPAQPDAERTPDGVIYDSCIHAFDPGGATTNALTVQIITYPTEQEVAKADPYRLLPDAEDVPGLQHPAKYSMLELSGSTEFLVVSVDGARVVKLITALPQATAWDKAEGKASMLKLAQAAKL